MKRVIKQKPVHTFTKLSSLDVALSVKALNDMTPYDTFLPMVTDPTSFARRKENNITFSYLQRDTDTRKRYG